jgi:hypothetical protein
MKHSYQLQKVDQVFDHWLDVNHYKEKALGHKISENWREIVGNTIYHHTARVDVRLPLVYLRIDNSSLKDLLYTDKQLFIDKINTYIKSTVVKEIIFN